MDSNTGSDCNLFPPLFSHIVLDSVSDLLRERERERESITHARTHTHIWKCGCTTEHVLLINQRPTNITDQGHIYQPSIISLDHRQRHHRQPTSNVNITITKLVNYCSQLGVKCYPVTNCHQGQMLTSNQSPPGSNVNQRSGSVVNQRLQIRVINQWSPFMVWYQPMITIHDHCNYWSPFMVWYQPMITIHGHCKCNYWSPFWVWYQPMITIHGHCKCNYWSPFWVSYHPMIIIQAHYQPLIISHGLTGKASHGHGLTN